MIRASYAGVFLLAVVPLAYSAGNGSAASTPGRWFFTLQRAAHTGQLRTLRLVDLRIAQAQRLQSAGNQVRHASAQKPLVIRGNDVPRRVPRARRPEHLLIR